MVLATANWNFHASRSQPGPEGLELPTPQDASVTKPSAGGMNTQPSPSARTASTDCSGPRPTRPVYRTESEGLILEVSISGSRYKLRIEGKVS